jgi:hypothetical protein
MANVQMVAMLGDIEVDIDDSAQEEMALRLPLTMQDGVFTILQFQKRDVVKLWEFLSAVRHQKAGRVRRSVKFALSVIEDESRRLRRPRAAGSGGALLTCDAPRAAAIK